MTEHYFHPCICIQEHMQKIILKDHMGSNNHIVPGIVFILKTVYIKQVCYLDAFCYEAVLL